MFFVIMALTSIKDLSVFVKLNMYGVIFTIIVTLYIFAYGIWGLTKGDIEYVWYLDNLGMKQEDI